MLRRTWDLSPDLQALPQTKYVYITFELHYGLLRLPTDI
jgi:hypothetical protein